MKVAERAAPVITQLAQTTFNAGQDPYGVTWAPGVNGDSIDLNDTGALARYVSYVAIGTKLRVSLGVPYAKYQIGKRPVFPSQGKTLPVAYISKLDSLTSDCIAEYLEGSK